MATAPNPKPHAKEVAIMVIQDKLEKAQISLSRYELTNLRLNHKPSIFSAAEAIFIVEQLEFHKSNVDQLKKALEFVQSRLAF